MTRLTGERWLLPPEGGMSGSPVAEGGVADRGGFYMTPWPLVGNNLPRLLLLQPGADRAGRLRHLPDRRVRHARNCSTATRASRVSCPFRFGRGRGRRSCPT